MPRKLDALFNPKTIAVIGATSRKGSVGYAVLSNLVGSDFDGIVYPINPKRPSVLGVKAYPSVLKTPDKVDLAIIATPAETVPDIVEECGQAEVRGVVIISAGFDETGAEGRKMSERMLATARKHGIRILGPNCLGFIKPSLHLNASFADKMPAKGRIAFISQSGALGTAIIDWAVKQNVGFSYFVSVGAMIDVGFSDLIDYFGQDPDTSSILIYMESLRNARKFMSAARAFSRSKPIIILKAGKSAEGAAAAKSHTGSITGNDDVFSAAFKRAGIIRVNQIGELFDCAKTLSMQRRPRGNRLAILTNAGGPGVLSADAVVLSGCRLAEISADTVKSLDAVMPPTWSRGNPVDILGDADPARYGNAAEACMADENVDGMLVILTPQAMTDAAETARRLVEMNDGRKTILASWIGGESVERGVEVLEKGGIPCFETPEEAVICFSYMYNYSRNIELLYETPATIPHAFVPETSRNEELIRKVAESGRFTLTEEESKVFLSHYGIPVAESGTARSAREAAEIAKRIGFPVAMKIASPDILHKTDAGGVRLGILSEKEVEDTFVSIMDSCRKHSPKADIRGVFVEAMASRKYEILIGAKKDPLFGPVIVFGLGGVAVEIFRDTNVGLPPLNMALSMRLIEDTKIYKLLRGYRGMPGADIKSIQFLLYKFAYLLMDFPEIKEIDINPFAVDAKGGIVLDAKVILDERVVGKGVKPYSHMVISPYPKQYVTTFKMNDGREVVLRPVRPEDEPLEAEMFTRFSERTQRFRFFQPIKDITHEMLVRYTQIDYDREIAIIAELDEKGRKVMGGVGRLIEDPYGETAEFAIVVADPWQNQGLGNRLTDYMMEIASKRGVRKVYASFLGENMAMRHIFEKRGFKVQRCGGDDTCYAELHLGLNSKES